MSAIPLEALAKDIRDRIAAADSKVGTTADILSEAARMLLEVKARIAETRETTFKAFLEQNGIDRSRAFELLAVAMGKKTIDGIRARNAERQAKHRATNRVARKSVSNGLGRSEREDCALLSVWKSAGKREREEFLRRIRSDIRDWYVPSDWYLDAAFELHIARGTPVPDGLARSRWYMFNPVRTDLLPPVPLSCADSPDPYDFQPESFLTKGALAS